MSSRREAADVSAVHATMSGHLPTAFGSGGFRLACCVLAFLLSLSSALAQGAGSSVVPAIINLDMEAAPAAGDGLAHWGSMSPSPAYKIVRDVVRPFEGRASLQIVSAKPVDKNDFGTAARTVDATPFRGKRIRLSAAARAVPIGGGWAGLWLRVDRPGRGGFFDNMADRPIRIADWKRYEIVGDVAADATTLNFGLLLSGGGRAWLDAVRLEIIGDSAPSGSTAVRTMRDLWRSAGRPREAPIPGDAATRGLTEQGRRNLVAFARAYGYVAQFDATDQAAAANWPLVAISAVEHVEGAADNAALAMALNEAIMPHAPDFCAYVALQPESCPPLPASNGPAIAWVHRGRGFASDNVYRSQRERIARITADRLLTVELGQGVMARIPLAAELNPSGATLPLTTLKPLPSRKPEGWTPAGFDRSTRLADVIIVWALYEHFYPYFDIVKTDWSNMLESSLDRAAIDADDRVFTHTIKRMIAGLEDGHGAVVYEPLPVGTLPVTWDWIDDQLVVTGVGPTVVGLQRGDVIRAMNGTVAQRLIANNIDAISGSPQWRRLRAVAALREGIPSQPATLTASRGGMEFEITLTFGRQAVTDTRPESFTEVRPGIVYVDLTRTKGEDVIAAITTLAAARGVIFDLRGYPSGTYDYLSYLSDRPIRSMPMRTPVIRRPDRQGWCYDEVRWNIAPLLPRIRRAVFLTDERAISYAESILATVKGNRLGWIIGEPTAGANGNISPVPLPGGYVVASTGMQVLGADRSVHHRIGVQPDLIITQALAGVRAGRDKILEAGISHLSRDSALK